MPGSSIFMLFMKSSQLKVTIVILFLSIILSAINLPLFAQEPDITLYAQAAVLMDATSGRVLYSKNSDEILAMASTTKILTCILALEYGDLTDYVEVSAYAAKMPKVKLNMRAGEFYRLDDLLYSLMLESHNDTAVAIAEHIGGSIEGFAKMMNDKAEEIGCKDSYFITPSGLDAETSSGKRHSTTARDLAAIMSYCIMDSPKKDEFLAITKTADYQFNNYKKTTVINSDENETDASEYKAGDRNISINNHNAFLNMMDGAFSGKTGYTSKAGYCYVGALERDGRIYVVALLACGWPNHKTYKWSDTRKLMEYGLATYFYRDVFNIPEVGALKVEDGAAESGNPYERVYIDLTIIHEEQAEQRLLREDEKINEEINLPEILAAPVEAGQQVGSVSYYLEGEKIKEYSIVTSEAVNKMDYRFIFAYILNTFCI